MNFKDCMKQIEALGTAQNRKVYAKHGAKEPMFGVSCANLGTLKKQLKTDHELALKLWASANYDARILATMIVDPMRLKSSEIDAWAGDLDCYPLTDALSGVVKKTPWVMKKLERWTTRKGDWICSAGWNLVGGLAWDEQPREDSFFEEKLLRIEEGIHTAPNRARYAMNNTLICIGCRNKNLQKKAVAAAKRIGKVEVDHGETGCKTPDAVSYIAKTLAHRAKKKKTARKKTRKKSPTSS